MIGTAKGLYDFWSSFGLNAYPEFAVPDDAELPYITYELKKPNWRDAVSYTVRVWYRDTSYDAITAKCEEIANAIGEGKMFAIDGGFVWLFADSSFLQFQPLEADETPYLKVAYLSMILHVLA